MHEEKKVAVRKSNANELRDHNCIIVLSQDL